MASAADVCIYGGSAGGGKTYALALDPLRHIHRKGFAAVVFRRTYPELRGAGSVWEECRGIYPSLGGVSRENVMDWRFPSGACVEFRHLQHESDKFSHQGKQYAAILFDELAGDGRSSGFSEEQFWYLVSRNRTTCGIRPYVRGTCNPHPDSFVRKLIDWWLDDKGFAIPERSGVLRYMVRDGDIIRWGDTPEDVREQPDDIVLSFTFIAAKLTDNQALLQKDPGYPARLRLLDPVQRARLLDGNWKARAVEGSYFRRRYFEVIDDLPNEEPIAMARGWDKAATKPHPGNTDPDWTRGALVYKYASGMRVIVDIAGIRDGPGQVDALMRRTAERDGPMVTQVMWQDPGQAGKVDAQHVRRVLDGYSIRTHVASRSKVAYASPWSSQAEGGNYRLLRAPWNDEFLAEAEGFPTAKHDDQIDAVSLAELDMGNRKPMPEMDVAGGSLQRSSPWKELSV